MSSSKIVDRPLDTAISDALTDLALDLRWSFNHSADQLWEQLDPELWELTHNPWVLLQTVSREKLQSVTSDPRFQGNCWLISTARKCLPKQSEAWFQKAHPRSGVSTIAYFSMEFMLSEALPIYSGGLGNVAGDQLKAASNLGVPVSELVCSTNKAIFGRKLMHKATSKLCTHSMIPASFRFDRCASQTANGCAWP
jgi:glucan phosphorylase